MVGLACGRETGSEATERVSPPEQPSFQVCPAEPRFDGEMPPGTVAKVRQRATWARSDDDQAWLSESEIGLLNRTSEMLASGPRDLNEAKIAAAESSQSAIDARIAYMDRALTTGVYVEADPGAFAVAKDEMRGSSLVDHLRLVVDETPLRCVPVETGIYKRPIDKAFDRNACASLHPGELVRVLRRSPSGRWLYVQAEYTVGWVRPDGLTPRLTREQRLQWSSGERAFSIDDDATTHDGFPIRLGTSYPVIASAADELTIWVPDATGLRQARVRRDAVHLGPLSFTRANLLALAFDQLDAPYGWGGRAGERDCSRYLRDLMATFGIAMGRHSSVQAQQGISIDIEGLTPAEKRNAIIEAGKRGAVLLYMPGHIMLYLGEHDGEIYAISAMSEWLEPCEGGPDTVHRIDRVEVTTLGVGRGTQRTSFLERMTRLAVFGQVS